MKIKNQVNGTHVTQDCRASIRDKSAPIIQRLIRNIAAKKKGDVSREQVSVRRVAPGVIHIQLCGDESLFARLGVSVQAGRGKRRVDILSIDTNQYEGHATGGMEIFNPVATNDEHRQTILGTSEYNVFINGGFFNANTRHIGFPDYMPIAPTHTPQTQNFVPAPENYQDQFGSIGFKDGSHISVAPILVQSGISKFPNELEKEDRFNFETIRGKNIEVKPGELLHASDPNPRAGIVTPKQREDFANSSTEATPSSSKQDRVRLAIAKATSRGKNSDGFTMSKWANTLSHLSKMNKNPGTGFNLDGGASAVMGITDNYGKITHKISQEATGRDVSTMLTFQRIAANDEKNQKSVMQ